MEEVRKVDISSLAVAKSSVSVNAQTIPKHDIEIISDEKGGLPDGPTGYWLYWTWTNGIGDG